MSKLTNIYLSFLGIVTGGPYHSGQGCQPYQIPSCDHHVPHSKNPCKGELPTPKCEHTCIDGKLEMIDRSDFQIFYISFKTICLIILCV